MTYGKTRRMVVVALIAAAYTAIGLALGEFGFGPVQFRVSEALTLLAVFSPICIEGLTLGCFLTNAVGVAMGLNILGPLDMLFGTAATLFAALLSYWLRRVRIGKVPALSSLPPVVINAVVIGLELAVVNPGGFNWAKMCIRDSFNIFENWKESFETITKIIRMVTKIVGVYFTPALMVPKYR